MRDGRRLRRFRAESIPEILNDEDIRPAVEARWCGCTLVADGLDLIVGEPWMSELPDQVRDGLAANAGTIIALLRARAGFVLSHEARSGERRRRPDDLAYRLCR